MRVVIADCSAIYTGRGDTQLGRAVRAVIIKADGSVSIHNDVGNKPLNYMKGAVHTPSIVDGVETWTFDSRNESLAITVHQVFSDVNTPLVEDDAGLIRDGTENQLQEWLSKNPEALGEGFTFVEREFQTSHGPVDLLVRNAEGRPIAVEVKRVAMLGAVDQVRRYVEAINQDSPYQGTLGMIAALDIRPRTALLAEKRGISLVTIPAYWRD